MEVLRVEAICGALITTPLPLHEDSCLTCIRIKERIVRKGVSYGKA